MSWEPGHLHARSLFKPLAVLCGSVLHMNTWRKLGTCSGSYTKRGFPVHSSVGFLPHSVFVLDSPDERCHSLSVLASQATVHSHTSGLVLEAKCGKKSWRKYWDLSYTVCITGPLFSVPSDGCFPRARRYTCDFCTWYCGSAVGLALEQG